MFVGLIACLDELEHWKLSDNLNKFVFFFVYLSSAFWSSTFPAIDEKYEQKWGLIKICILARFTLLFEKNKKLSMKLGILRKTKNYQRNNTAKETRKMATRKSNLYREYRSRCPVHQYL